VDVINKINSFVWADWSLDDFKANYEKIIVKVSYNAGNYYSSEETINETNANTLITIHCNNYIGFSFIGHWDENIIEHIRIEPDGDLVVNSSHEIKRNYGEPPIPSLGGGIKKIDGPWYQLNIKLIDGNSLKVACGSFDVEMPKY
jgi:hypothetical protein